VKNASAATITFDDFEFSGTSFTSYFDPLDIGEYRFTPIDSPSIPVLGFYQQNSSFYRGSAGIIGGNGSNITLERIDGNAFSVSSLDVVQIFALETPLELVGTLTDGSTITQVFLNDFSSGYQSLILTDFGNITSLRLGAIGENNANLAAWDNIVLSTPVPLPASIWLFLSAFSILFSLGWKNKRSISLDDE